jgi:hypothetical protein
MDSALMFMPADLVDCIREYNMPTKENMAGLMCEVVNDINFLGTLGQLEGHKASIMLYYTYWISATDYRQYQH